MLTRQDILCALREAGLGEGACLIAHTSLKSMGLVKDGANTVIDALLEVVGHSGNVMVPTLTGHRGLSASNPPVFDPDATPCWTGLIPETFRKRPESVRSLHPTHSVAVIGPDAAWFTEGHERCASPCGEGSPYERLVHRAGIVLLIGVGVNRMTLLHHVEEIARSPYILQPQPVDATIIVRGVPRKVRLHIHSYAEPRAFERLESPLLEHGIMTQFAIGSATTYVVRARETRDFVLERLREDPLYLTAKQGA